MLSCVIRFSPAISEFLVMASSLSPFSYQSKIEQYLDASVRENTRRSYQSAIRHFELEWNGFLPATAESVARYLADYADSLSATTLRHRLAALAQWHNDQGFPDPTKAPVVRQVLRGIRVLHPVQPKQARPLQLDQLEKTVVLLDSTIAQAREESNRPRELRSLRDKSLLLLGFWRGFRVDELTRLQVEAVQVEPGAGMTCYLSRSKGDRNYIGASFQVPALSRLCPVDAYLDWLSATQLKSGAVFRAIDQWGHLGERGLNPDSVIPLLRDRLQRAGIPSAELYSGHSLRRGFANWAVSCGWDVKTLMEYIGWQDAKSAMRYIDAADPYFREKITASL